MKTLLRILLILVAATAVVGATVALTQVEAVQSAIGSGRHGPPQGVEGEMPDFAASDAEAAGEARTATAGAMPAQRGGHEARGGSLAGLGEVLKNFVIVALITLVVAVPSALAQRLRRQRRLAAAAGQMTPM